MTHRFGVWIAVSLVALMAPAGCGDGRNPSASSTATTTTGASWDRPDAPPDPRTLLHAAALAVTTVPNSTLILIESETGDAGTWKARVATPDGTEQQMKIGSDGITVLVDPTPENDSDPDKAQRRAEVAAAHLDYRAAVDKVLAAVPDGSITELRLQNTDGTTAWGAHVWDTYLVGHEVTINAASGDLIGDKQV